MPQAPPAEADARQALGRRARAARRARARGRTHARGATARRRSPTDRRSGRGRGRLVGAGAQPASRAGARAPRASIGEETGRAAVALLDDLDSELDEDRAGALCAESWRGAARPGSRRPTPAGRRACARWGASSRSGGRGALRLAPEGDGGDMSETTKTQERRASRAATTAPRRSASSKGLEAVRVRPAMYIGSTGEAGLHHLVYEVVDNSVDEALAGLLHARSPSRIHIDNSVTVVDDGRGIPVGPHRVPGSTPPRSCSRSSTPGGKFDKKRLQGLGRPARRRASRW